jgi:hypothetical protein
MSGSSLRRLRPSPSMAVALVALFVSLGGVGFAATQLAQNSVGTAQLKDGAVTFTKLANGAVGATKIFTGAVGATQIDSNAVQRRVKGSCKPSMAVAWVYQGGQVGCNVTLPRESGAANSQVSIGDNQTAVLRKPLDPGTGYLVFANPSVIISGTVPGQQVVVQCTLTVGPSSQARSLMVEIGPNHQQQEALIPLIVADQGIAKAGAPAPAPRRRWAYSPASVPCRRTATANP